MTENLSPPPETRSGTPPGPAASRWRLVVLLAVLVLLAAVAPRILSQIEDWRQRQRAAAEKAEPRWEPAEPSRAALNDSAPPAPAKPAPPSPAKRTMPAPPPTFPELPADPAERIRVVREEAFQTAQQLIADLPDESKAVGLLALTHTRFGNTDQAEQSWKRCLELSPQFADAYAGLGVIAHERGDDEAAVEHLQDALQRDPTLSDARSSLADALMSLKRMQEAADVLEEEVRRFPTATGSWYRLGQAYLQLGDYQKAAAGFETAIRTDAGCVYAYYGLANARRRLGQPEEFARHMRTFKELKEKDLGAQRESTRRFDDEGAVRRAAAFVHAGAGRVYADHHEIVKAEAHWKRATRLDVRDTVARGYLVQMYEVRSRLTDVMALLEELRQIEPQNPRHGVSLGIARARSNDVAGADQAFRQALHSAPHDPAPYAALAEFHLRTGRHLDEARTLAERAVALSPTAPYYGILLGVCQRTGDHAAALAAVERLLVLAPDNPRFQQLRTQLQAQLTKP